jgi:hypothetical protein
MMLISIALSSAEFLIMKCVQIVRVHVLNPNLNDCPSLRIVILIRTQLLAIYPFIFDAN